MNKFFIVLTLSLFTLGVGTLGAGTMNVDSEGTMRVSRKEAILIAQELMQKQGLDRDWNIKRPRVHYENKNEIGIRFYTKHPFAMSLKYALPYLVVVSKEDGKVTVWGQDK